MLVHFIAAWFIMQSFRVLAQLYNVKMFVALQKMVFAGGKAFNAYMQGKQFNIGDVLNYGFYTNATWMLGWLTALILSLLICRRHKWFWLNAVIAFIVLFILQRQYYAGWIFLKYIFMAPGDIFHSSFLYLLTNGLLLLVLGLFTFYYKRLQRFIDGGYLHKE